MEKKMADKVKNARVIAIDAHTHKILRIYAAQNDRGIAEVANKAILQYIATSELIKS